MVKKYEGAVHWRLMNDVLGCRVLQPLARVLAQQELDKISNYVGGTGRRFLRHETQEGVIQVLVEKPIAAGGMLAQSPRVFATIIPPIRPVELEPFLMLPVEEPIEPPIVPPRGLFFFTNGELGSPGGENRFVLGFSGTAGWTLKKASPKILWGGDDPSDYATYNPISNSSDLKFRTQCWTGYGKDDLVATSEYQSNVNGVLGNKWFDLRDPDVIARMPGTLVNRYPHAGAKYKKAAILLWFYYVGANWDNVLVAAPLTTSEGPMPLELADENWKVLFTVPSDVYPDYFVFSRSGEKTTALASDDMGEVGLFEIIITGDDFESLSASPSYELASYELSNTADSCTPVVVTPPEVSTENTEPCGDGSNETTERELYDDGNFSETLIATAKLNYSWQPDINYAWGYVQDDKYILLNTEVRDRFSDYLKTGGEDYAWTKVNCDKTSSWRLTTNAININVNGQEERNYTFTCAVPGFPANYLTANFNRTVVAGHTYYEYIGESGVVVSDTRFGVFSGEQHSSSSWEGYRWRNSTLAVDVLCQETPVVFARKESTSHDATVELINPPGYACAGNSLSWSAPSTAYLAQNRSVSTELWIEGNIVLSYPQPGEANEFLTTPSLATAEGGKIVVMKLASTSGTNEGIYGYADGTLTKLDDKFPEIDFASFSNLVPIGVNRG
jgi:hypothetical protein